MPVCSGQNYRVFRYHGLCPTGGRGKRGTTGHVAGSVFYRDLERLDYGAYPVLISSERYRFPTGIRFPNRNRNHDRDQNPFRKIADRFSSVLLEIMFWGYESPLRQPCPRWGRGRRDTRYYLS
jgi:hypothetical protein